MNGISCSHWGITIWPDDERWKNILVCNDGTVSQFETGQQTQMQSFMPQRRGIIAGYEREYLKIQSIEKAYILGNIEVTTYRSAMRLMGYDSAWCDRRLKKLKSK